MKLAPLLILLALLAACAPSPVAQAQAGASVAPNAGIDLAAINAQATQVAAWLMQTQAAQAREAAQAATAQAVQDRAYALEATIAAGAAQREAARLEMDRQQAMATGAANATADHWGGLATQGAQQATGTMAVMQAQAQGSIATATANSDQATAMVIAAQSSAEALLIPRRGHATDIALVAMPTEAARNAQAQRERLDGFYSTASLLCGVGWAVIVGVIILLLVRLENAYQRMIEMRTPLIRQLPAQPAAEQIPAAPTLTTPQRFIAACIQAAGADATTLPGWRDLPGEFGNGSGWSGVVALLSGTPYLLIERGTDGRYHPVNGMTLREVYDLLPHPSA